MRKTMASTTGIASRLRKNMISKKGMRSPISLISAPMMVKSAVAASMSSAPRRASCRSATHRPFLGAAHALAMDVVDAGGR
jgi:hypothetical protein